MSFWVCQGLSYGLGLAQLALAHVIVVAVPADVMDELVRPLQSIADLAHAAPFVWLFVDDHDVFFLSSARSHALALGQVQLSSYKPQALPCKAMRLVVGRFNLSGQRVRGSSVKWPPIWAKDTLSQSGAMAACLGSVNTFR